MEIIEVLVWHIPAFIGARGCDRSYKFHTQHEAQEYVDFCRNVMGWGVVVWELNSLNDITAQFVK